MASEASLLGASLLLSDKGWLPANLISAGEIWGIDRHGKPATAQVSIKPADGENLGIFIGSTTAFGVFSEKCRLQLYGGGHASPASLIMDGTIGERRFEGWHEWSDEKIGDDATGAIWSALQSASAFVDDQEVIIRSRGAPTRKRGKRIWYQELKYKDRIYWRTDRNSFFKAIEHDCLQVIEDVLGIWGVNEEGGYEFEREQSILALWGLSALKDQGDNAVLGFDSLQHTIGVRLSVADVDTVSVPRGGCCFVGSRYTGLVLNWTAFGWSPICNGLLLAAN